MRVALALAGLAVAGGMATGVAATSGARAELRDAAGKDVGVAEFRQTAKGVEITLDLRGLPPGVHALHIHEKALCEGPGFATAGGHFNPFGKKHGLKNPEGPHAGDLPNLRVKDDGTFRGSFLAPLVTLGSGRHSLLEGEGTSLVIHEGADDGTSDPAGGAGDRIACGPIRKAAP